MISKLFSFLFIILISLSLSLILFTSSLMLNYSYMDVLWSLGIQLDFSFVTKTFLLTLVIIFTSVVIFSLYYQGVGLDYTRFILMVLWFVLSMLILVFHKGLFLLLVGWDGLGLSSYFLILYYLNWSSISNALFTMMTSRFGDFCLFWFIVTSIFSQSQWLLWSTVIMLMLSAFTKSAQFPFSSWLPLAMSAPTPVSALVHSSTLVTAGLYLLIKYNYLVSSSIFLLIMLVFGQMTSLIAGSMALLESDGKKLVALSTMSQLGFMGSTLGLGLIWLAFFHLLSHAFFKSLMFIQVGVFIHSNYSQQDAREWTSSATASVSSLLIMIVCVVSLMGLVFTSGFISKDSIVEALNVFVSGTVVLILYYIILSLTFLYSLKLLWSLLKLGITTQVSMVLDSTPAISSMVLFLLSIGFMTWFEINMSYSPTTILSLEKSFVVIALMVSLLMWVSVIKFSAFSWAHGLLGQDYLIKSTKPLANKGINLLETSGAEAYPLYIKSMFTNLFSTLSAMVLSGPSFIVVVLVSLLTLLFLLV